MDEFDYAAWQKANQDIDSLRAVMFDLNGVMRGKRLPVSQLKKITSGEMRMPFSTANVDIWGRDIENSKWVFATGDADGLCVWTKRGPLPMTDIKTGKRSAMLPLGLHNEDGTPFMGDARNVLASVLERYHAEGMTPVAGVELEFYLASARKAPADIPVTPLSPMNGATSMREAVLAVDELNDYDAFLTDLYAACAAQDVAVDAATSESGQGQFEVTLAHQSDLLKVADDAMLFKHITKYVARQHGMAASFMAKPYAERPGSGLHVHISLIDDAGRNLFDDGGALGNDMMRYAIGGLLAHMADSMLIFAPHLNSYRRLALEMHAPVVICWGYENRTVAVRVPHGSGAARRIEHRVAGADCNPYLMLAIILATAMQGMQDKTDPGSPIADNAYAHDLPRLPDNWQAAIHRFEASPIIQSLLPSTCQQMFVDCKIQEYREFQQQISPFEYFSYLDQV
ncbi:glutamine synthetase family protein [Candidatus Puniceispirillum sp.]|uniref:glutamine synthetase family protein n=1 Tax=Candidatus Puniceispirillum sp. TaxID=2026719 RepID=UPI003F69AF89